MKSECAENFKHPSLGANFLTQFMVFWITPLIRKAKESQLKDSDVWECPPEHSVIHSHNKFKVMWELEKKLCIEEQRDPSLFRAILRCFWPSFLISGAMQLVFVAFQLGQPFMIGKLVQHVRTGDGGVGVGIGLALGLGAISICSSISISVVFYITRIIGVEAKAAMMMAVYEKTLSITSSAKQENTVGQTTNLAAIDAEKIFLAAQFPHFLWQGPLTCLIVMGILIGEVGYGPALAGMAVLAVLVPIQNNLSGTIGDLRRGMIKQTDKRVMLINEILQAIRIIKLYAWEEPMEERVRQCRNSELKQLNSYLNTNGWLREVLFVIQPVAVLVIYLTSLYGFNRPLDQVQVIKVISFLVITRFPLNLLGVALKSLKDGSVSLQRLQRYLLLPVVESSRDTAAIVAQPKIEITNAVLSWGEALTTSVPINQNETNSVDSEAHTPTKHSSSYERVTTSVDDVEMTELKARDDQSSTIGCSFKLTEQEHSISHTRETQSPSPEHTRATFSFSMKIPTFRTTKNNELIAIVGSVGSGKSSFISSLLREMPVRDTVVSIQEAGRGCVAVDGPISYCAQTPWIQNMSLRNNVLFGQDVAKSNEVYTAYKNSLSAACLVPDLQILPDGDETEIGERGINLSGGQKARVSLARAFMSAQRSQVFLLDDPFSAVDGATGNWIFEHGVLRLLNDKIRIVALNSHLHLLKYFDRIVVLEGGEIIADGSPQELSERHAELVTRVTGSSPEDLFDQNNPHPAATVLATAPSSVKKSSSGRELEAIASKSTVSTASDAATVCDSTEDAAKLTPIVSDGDGEGKGEENSTDPPPKKPAGVLIQAERAAVGAVSTGTYVRYFSASLMPRSFLRKDMFYCSDETINFRSWSRFIYGIIILLWLVILFLIVQVARVGVDYILIRWATNGGEKDSVLGKAYYITFGVLIGVLVVRCYLLNFFAVRSSRNIHAAVFRAVISASVPLFYDTHTIGEVLNRFSKDCETMDVNIPEFFLQMLINQLQVLSVFALCVFASPWFALILLPLGMGFYSMFIYFSAVSRDLKRLESSSRSPIYAALSETMTGLETIRAYGDTDRFFRNYLVRMERNEKFFFHLWMSMSWVTARLELASSTVLLAVALLTVSLRTSVSPIALGLALSYSLQLTALFQRTVQLTIDVTTYMTSTERICEYLKVPQEKSVISNKPKVTEGTLTIESGDSLTSLLSSSVEWVPKSGSVEFRNVWLSYRGNPPILKGVNFAVRHGERVGVCGRTGAGKSSLMVALFRMVELDRGNILIDGSDVSQVPLQILRSKLAIIPQDPVLLTGTLRFQLDPFNAFSDTEVWDALDQVNMRETVQSFPLGLGELIRENGENLSQGQRQLICIARALLRRTQVLVVDEGTSAVDPYTDELVQKVLREQATLHGTTILAIAHRLQTILDFDRILVMGDGHVLEFDSPEKLRNDCSSVFYSMLSEREN